MSQTILVVDDDSSVLAVLSRLLEDVGFCVLAAPTTAEAIRVAGDPEVVLDLAVVDIMVRGVNGDAVAGVITATRPALPILFLTGVIDVPRRLDRVPYRWELMHKPVLPARFIEQVREMISEERL